MKRPALPLGEVTPLLVGSPPFLFLFLFLWLVFQ